MSNQCTAHKMKGRRHGFEMERLWTNPFDKALRHVEGGWYACLLRSARTEQHYGVRRINDASIVSNGRDGTTTSCY